MRPTTRLLFSKFKAQEFEQLCQLLCRVFDTTPEELEGLYQDIDKTFDQPGCPLHFVHREFFKPKDASCRSLYQNAPVVAVDLPSVLEYDNGHNDKPTIVLAGQDPLNRGNYKKLIVGTPYGFHHKDSREKHTRFYLEMIKVLLELGYRVYLTDVFKIWIHGLNVKKWPDIDKERFLGLLKSELDLIQPSTVITFGKTAEEVFVASRSRVKHIPFPHPSRSNQKKWKETLNGESATEERKLAFVRAEIIRHLKQS
ncbi:MAG: uracil-DNA glycosylase family protein [Snowella sp.]|nr:uracil-DNA glycosylase family protein [Snowella sp.]